MIVKTIQIYKDRSGREPYLKWIATIKSEVFQMRIEQRIDNLQQGNYGNFKLLGADVYELKLDFGPGYRIYYGLEGLTVVILLCAGSKNTQQDDIRRAKEYWKDYKERKNGTKKL